MQTGLMSREERRVHSEKSGSRAAAPVMARVKQYSRALRVMANLAEQLDPSDRHQVVSSKRFYHKSVFFYFYHKSRKRGF